MPFFEFDDGRLVPARFGHPVTTEIEPELLQAVRSQVLEVVQRSLFPVTWHGDGRRPGTYRDADAPEPRLTAMDASGQVVTVEVVNRLDSASLVAALSRAGRNSDMGWTELGSIYPRGMAAFRRDWNIFRESMPPRPAPGPRLIVVAGTVEDEVRPALEVLGRSGVVVHEIAVRQMSNGRQFVEVNELRPDLLHDTGTVLSAGTPRPEMTAGPRDMTSAGTPAGTAGTATGGAVELAPRAPSASTAGPSRAQMPGAQMPGAQMSGTQTNGRRTSATTDPNAAARPVPDTPSVAAVHDGAADLSDIAAALGSETPLLWFQHRRGIRHDATLTADGALRLPGGSTYTDPDLAARAVSGRDDVDGWRVWRFGESGPSLGDARAELAAARRARAHHPRHGARAGRRHGR